MAAARVVEREIAADAGPRLGDGGVRVQIDLLVLDRAPEPLDEDVVAPAALAIRYTDRLVEAGVDSSVGSRGDANDNALAETSNGLYEAEVSVIV